MEAKQERFVRLPEVKARVGLSRSAIYARIAKGEFPKPISLGGGQAVAWPASQIDAWIAQRIAEANAQPVAA